MTLKLTIKDVKITPSGGLTGRARVTGVGVLDYTWEYGVHIYRSEAETFDPDSLDSLKNIPLTDSHPDDEEVDGENFRWNTIGTTGSDIQRIDDDVDIDWSIWDTKMAMKVLQKHQAGERIQWSIGAKGMPEFIEGNYRGTPYQVELKKIRYNHLAVLLYEQGRHPTTDITDKKPGQKIMIFMDSAPSVINNKPQEVPPVKIKLSNGVEIEVADAAEAKHLENELDSYKDLKGQLSAANKQLNDAKANILDSSARKELIKKGVKLAAEAATLVDKLPEELAELDERQVYELVASENGYTDEDLKVEDTATLRGIYKQILKGRGSNESESFLDSASATSETLRQKQAKTQSGGEVIIDDRLGEIQQAKAEKLLKGARA